MSLFRKALALSMVLFMMFPLSFLRAEKVDPRAKDFSLQIPGDWMELPLPYQGVVVSYGKKGTLATFHITERALEGSKTVDQLNWEDLFSPQFKSIEIHTQNATVLGGEKAKFCVYTLKPGEFKDTMEGKLPGKYINYVLIHQGKLFSVTFKDTEEGFSATYPSFLAVIRTFRFDGPPTVSQRRTT